MLKLNGGPGMLVLGVPGTHPAEIVVLGGGVAGTSAISVAVRLGAQVTVLDTNVQRLRELDALYAGRIKTIASNGFEIERALLTADLVIVSVFYCVANMPGAVPHTSTYALTNATMPYVRAITNLGWRAALSADPALA